jgi:hypothetical protein
MHKNQTDQLDIGKTRIDFYVIVSEMANRHFRGIVSPSRYLKNQGHGGIHSNLAIHVFPTPYTDRYVYRFSTYFAATAEELRSTDRFQDKWFMKNSDVHFYKDAIPLVRKYTPSVLLQLKHKYLIVAVPHDSFMPVDIISSDKTRTQRVMKFLKRITYENPPTYMKFVTELCKLF